MSPLSSLKAPALSIQRPTLLLDRRKAVRNIEKMAAKASKSGVRFRPHFKTHRSAAVGEWFRDVGVEAITVSSVDMAIYFAQHGWKDITIAFPANVLEVDKISSLAEEIELGLLVESAEVVRFLPENLDTRANAWIKVDVGYGRTGIPWERAGAVIELAREIAKTGVLTFKGLLTHAGHSYHASSREELLSIHRDSVRRLSQVQHALQTAGFSQVELSIGDTPTCSVVDDFRPVDEIRPGNFVFYDLKQARIGSCSEGQIAVAVGCPVVAKHPERCEVILYGGAAHLSKESLVADGVQIFGRVAQWEGDGWGKALPDTYLSSLSQEHGVVRTTAQIVSQIKVGDVLIVLPVHSCLLSYLLIDYHTLDGEVLPSQSSTCGQA
jgi:D-serine deaminase-like pyridoxal phosphate-dependent protein